MVDGVASWETVIVIVTLVVAAPAVLTGITVKTVDDMFMVGVPVIAQVTLLKIKPDGRAGVMLQDVRAVPVHPVRTFPGETSGLLTLYVTV